MLIKVNFQKLTRLLPSVDLQKSFQKLKLGRSRNFKPGGRLLMCVNLKFSEKNRWETLNILAFA